MTTVEAIAREAFDAVAAEITDAVHDCTVTDGATEYEGRAVVAKESPSAEFPKFTPSASASMIVLEGLAGSPADGWELTIGAVDWLVIRVVDIVQAGGLYTVQAVKTADMWNASVSIQSKTRTADGMGGFAVSWSNPSAVDCYLEGIGGAERWQAMRVAPGNRWRCIIAYQAGVSAGQRAVIGSNVYNIEAAVDMGGRGVWLEMTLGEGQP